MADVERTGPAVVPAETVDAVIGKLFRVGLVLAPCAGGSDADTAGRLELAAEWLNETIDDLRRSALEQRLADHGEVPPSVLEIDEIIDGLASAARRAITFAGYEPLGAANAVHLLDAAHSAYRVLHALDQARVTGDSLAPPFS